ncbi:hypothetical protein CBR_g72668 [Chara braunii]|uniref:Uncharacterized protein n=1 Tax=Chara braunii TaxID=69332 RepID=A0A388KAE1_CHABU|nr:hypothetical protein CBR_g72668 [Chara braunii]|eukprot:GBG66913.1 hypothetical protein CBR_g72668 [Chara braunii]
MAVLRKSFSTTDRAMCAVAVFVALVLYRSATSAQGQEVQRLKPVDLCDFFMEGLGYGDIPVIVLNATGSDQSYGVPLTSMVVQGVEQKVLNANSGPCAFLSPAGVDFSCDNQLYVSGRVIRSRTFNRPIYDFINKLVVIYLVNVQLNGTTLFLNDTNTLYRMDRRCVAVYTMVPHDGSEYAVLLEGYQRRDALRSGTWQSGDRRVGFEINAHGRARITHLYENDSGKGLFISVSPCIASSDLLCCSAGMSVDLTSIGAMAVVERFCWGRRVFLFKAAKRKEEGRAVAVLSASQWLATRFDRR